MSTPPALTELMGSAMEAKNTGSTMNRSYLGMSSIGDCDAKLWMAFRSTKGGWFPAETLYKFDDGHHSEKVTAERIGLIPSVELVTTDPNTGMQFEYTAIGGHFKGHSDGVITCNEIPFCETAIWEHKCVDHLNFNKLGRIVEKEGEHNALRKWSANYYAQTQMYMHYHQLNYSLHTVATSGSRKYQTVVTPWNSEAANRLIDKAYNVIHSEDIPDQINSKCIYPCTYCNFNKVCFGGEILPPSCKTCIFGSPSTTSKGKPYWACSEGNELSKPGVLYCDNHLYSPYIFKYVATQIDSDRDFKEIIYEKKKTFEIFYNQPKTKGKTSWDLYHEFKKQG